MRSQDDRVGVFVPLWAMAETDGDPRDAMVLAQITWWLQPTQRTGLPRTRRLIERSGAVWLYLTDADLACQLGMSPDQVYRARRSLRKRGLIDYQARQVHGAKVTCIRVLGFRDPAVSCTREVAVSDSATSRHAPSTDRGKEMGSSAERARPCRIPDGWTPNPEALVWAAAGWPSVDAVAETERFVDYWRGTGKPMVDWSATWRNWIRRAGERVPVPRSGLPARGQAPARAVVDEDRDGPEGLIQL